MAIRSVTQRLFVQAKQYPEIGLRRLASTEGSHAKETLSMEKIAQRTKNTWQTIQKSRVYRAGRCAMLIGRGVIYVGGELAGAFGKFMALTALSYAIAPETTKKIIKAINSAPPVSG